MREISRDKCEKAIYVSNTILGIFCEVSDESRGPLFREKFEMFLAFSREIKSVKNCQVYNRDTKYVLSFTQYPYEIGKAASNKHHTLLHRHSSNTTTLYTILVFKGNFQKKVSKYLLQKIKKTEIIRNKQNQNGGYNC